MHYLTRSTLMLSLALSSAFAQTAPVFEFPRELAASEDVAALDAFATEQEAEQNFDFAAQALERAVSLRPDDATLRTRLAENLYRTGPGAHAAALEHANAVVEKPGVDAALRERALLVRGLVHLARAMADAAAVDFGAVLQGYPSHTRAALGMAAAELAQGKPAQAAARLTELGEAAKPYAIETRYLLRAALQQFAQSRPQVTEAMRPALEVIATHAGIARPSQQQQQQPVPPAAQ